MQNNEFDHRIREMLESNSPAYNPADWDRMEDMLQNLPGAGQTGQSAGAGAKAVAGKLAIGAKTWIAASIAAVTIANVALYMSGAYSEKNSLQAPAATQTESLVTDITARSSEEIQAAASVTANVPTTENESDNTLPDFTVEAKKPAPGTPDAEKSAVAGKDIAPLVLALEFTNRQEQNLPQGSKNQSTIAGFGNGGNVISGGAAATGGSSSGGSHLLAASITTPCTARPALPFIIAGLDTLTSFEFKLDACEPVCLRLPATTKDGGEVLFSSANLGQLPGARLEVNPENRNTASFCWTPKSEHARTEPYILNVSVKNAGCTNPSNYTIRFFVAPSANVRITGDSLLLAGQQTRLKAVSSSTEARFAWQQVAGLEGALNSREITVQPAATTTYRVTMTSPNGCVTTANHTVRVADALSSGAVFIPNVFTPNGDGINDLFEVKGIASGDMELTVFSRYGRQVYHSAHYDNNWDGRNQPNGIYTYLLRQLSTGKLLKGAIEIKGGQRPLKTSGNLLKLTKTLIILNEEKPNYTS